MGKQKLPAPKPAPPAAECASFEKNKWSTRSVYKRVILPYFRAILKKILSSSLDRLGRQRPLVVEVGGLVGRGRSEVVPGEGPDKDVAEDVAEDIEDKNTVDCTQVQGERLAARGASRNRES